MVITFNLTGSCLPPSHPCLLLCGFCFVLFVCVVFFRDWGTHFSKCLSTKMVRSGVDIWGREIPVWWQPRRQVMFLHWLKLFLHLKSERVPWESFYRAQEKLVMLQGLNAEVLVCLQEIVGSDSEQGSHHSVSCSFPGQVSCIHSYPGSNAFRVSALSRVKLSGSVKCLAV